MTIYSTNSKVEDRNSKRPSRPSDFFLPPGESVPVMWFLSALVVPLILSSAVTASAQIRALTQESLREVLTQKEPPPSRVWQSLDQLSEAPFGILIHTPAGRAYDQTAEARRKFLDPPSIDIEAENGLGVQLRVGAWAYRHEVIESVVLKRGEQIIRPTLAKVTPLTIRNEYGATKASAQGLFSFPLEVFDPVAGPLTIVCIGTARNYELTMTVEALRELR